MRTKEQPTKQDIRRFPEDYSTQELKTYLEDWEQIYTRHTTGQLVYNDILGYVHQGTVDFAIKMNAIVFRHGTWFVNSNYDAWKNKCLAMKHIQYGRFLAAKSEHLSLGKCTDDKCKFCHTPLLKITRTLEDREREDIEKLDKLFPTPPELLETPDEKPKVEVEEVEQSLLDIPF